jgi:PAS domain S-box-containing protein
MLSEGNKGNKSDRPRHKAILSSAASIVAVYVAAGVLWIVFSDRILLRLVPELPRFTWLSTAKGLAFIAVTAVILYVVLSRYVSRLENLRDRLEERIEEKTADLSRTVETLHGEVLARKEAEETQRQQFQFLQVLLDATSVPIFWKNAQGLYLGCNTAFGAFIGRPKDQIVGKSVYDISPKELADIYYRKDEELFIRPGVQVYEASVLPADGVRRDAIFNKATFLNEDGSIGGLVGTILDISERKRAEEALRESEEYNRNLFEQSPIGLALCRMDGTFVDVNSAYAKIIGRSVEETMALTYWDITPKKYFEQEQTQLESLAKTGQYGPYEKEYTHKDGHLVPVRLSGRIIERQGAQFIWSSVEDITERRQTQLALQKAYDELEIRVEERTAELRRLNESLEQEIAEHKKTEETLKLTHFSIDHAHAEVFWISRDASITFVNDYACQMLGYSREEMLKMRVPDIDPNYPMESWSSHWEQLKQKGTMTFESEHRTKEGRLIPVEIRVNYLEFRGQEYNFAVAQDISERKAAEDKIKNLAKIPSENPYPIIRIGWDGNVLYANQASEPYLAEWGMQVGSIVPENIRKVMSLAVDSCTKQEIELTHGGRVFSFTVAPIMDSYYCNLYARDVTEAKQAQDQLIKLNRALWVLSQCNQIMVRAREETEFLNAVCTTIVDYGGYRLVWVGFAENGENNIIRPVAYAGYEDGYLSTVKIAWDDSERGRSPAGVAIRTGEPAVCRDMMTDPAYAAWRDEAAKRGYASSVAFPLVDGGLTLGALSIYAPVADAFGPQEIELLTELANDMAYGIRAIRTRLEREKAEASLKRLNKELVRKNKELESIIFIASHDLRSALVNVQGFSKELGMTSEVVRTALSRETISRELMLQIQKPLQEDIPEAVDFVIKSTAKIDALLNGLLRLSRVGREEMNVVPLDMNALMAEIVRTMQFRIAQAGARIALESLPACIGDYSLISQVFSSIIDNSIKFLDKTRPGLIRITGRTDDDLSIYCVEDNGIGIESAYKGKIFEIFQRLGPGESPGEGLGLTIVRQIVERHNGRVWIESEYGKGSKFFVSLPNK